MRSILKTIGVAWLIFLLQACVGSMPKYQSNQSHYIIFKTPKFAYADMGFIAKADNEVKVEIYSNGQALIRLRITPSQVCMSSIKCMSADSFNKEYLAASYPKDTLFKIFRGETIFNGKEKKSMENGFVQHIDSIEYIVNGDRVNFKDSSTGVKIEIK